MIKIDPEIIARQARLREERYQRAKDKIKERTRQRRLADPQLYLWDKARRRASKEELPFNIEPSDITIPKTCPALGITIGVLSTSKYNSATVDKIIPDKGYVKGNIAVISRRANELKRDASLQELISLARWLESILEEEEG